MSDSEVMGIEGEITTKRARLARMQSHWVTGRDSATTKGEIVRGQGLTTEHERNKRYTLQALGGVLSMTFTAFYSPGWLVPQLSYNTDVSIFSSHEPQISSR